MKDVAEVDSILRRLPADAASAACDSVLEERDALRVRLKEQDVNVAALRLERDALRARVKAQRAKEAKLWAERCRFLAERNALHERAKVRRKKESALWAERCRLLGERNALRKMLAQIDDVLAAKTTPTQQG